MKKQEIDYWITTMLEAHKNVSDLNITVGKKLQVEADGQLMPVQVTPPVEKLSPFQAEAFAMNLIGNNKRLLSDLVENGSEVLKDYNLSSEAKAALMCGDLGWINRNIGELTQKQLMFISARMESEVW